VSELKGKVAIISGGASGIGRASALLFASKGCQVMLADEDRPGAAAVLDELQRGDATRGACMPVDVSDSAQVEAVVKATVARFGRLDILLNSAAIYPTFPSLVETPDVAWAQVLSVNLTGTFLFCKHAIPAMLASGEGAIVNLSSIAALRGTSYSVPYGVAKAGVIQLTRAAAVQYGARGIRTNCIVPGLVDTPMSRKSTGTAEEFDRYVQQIPVGRAGTPEDIASLALFLVSKEAVFINGAAIVIDGGTMAG
jgi:NAD(P)-dependent dehydrogenase (short-subunit alcohol dehydrogenase family)